MGKPISVTITNAEEIKRAYSLAPALMTMNLNKAIRASIENIKASSMEHTPVRTGVLRASHYTKFSPLRGEVGADPSDDPAARGVNYAIFVHDGTKFMKANPFLKYAVEDEEKEVQKLFIYAVQDVLNKIGKMS